MRLIGPWCQVNIGSCRFMLGQCYLANGEGQKVSDVDQREPDDITASQLTCSPLAVCPSGAAVFPGGGDRGREGGVSDATDRH